MKITWCTVCDAKMKPEQWTETGGNEYLGKCLECSAWMRMWIYSDGESENENVDERGSEIGESTAHSSSTGQCEMFGIIRQMETDDRSGSR